MEKTIIAEGKTSTEAIERGLKQLNCNREDVEIKVLENEEKRSFFSILEPRVVKVELTLKETKKTVQVKEKRHTNITKKELDDCKNNIDNFLMNFANKLGKLEYTIEDDNDTLIVKIYGENAQNLIGYRGETVNAIQNIISAIGNKNIENRVRVLVDICGYKKKREETLKELAKKLEKTVKRNGRKIILEPMNSYDRKIIHTALQDSEYVITYSIGEEPRRKVVVAKK